MQEAAIALEPLRTENCDVGSRAPGLGSMLVWSWNQAPKAYNIGALIFRIGVWGLFYYSYNKDPPK